LNNPKIPIDYVERYGVLIRNQSELELALAQEAYMPEDGGMRQTNIWDHF
jgi:hypothetical protein